MVYILAVNKFLFFKSSVRKNSATATAAHKYADIITLEFSLSVAIHTVLGACSLSNA